MTRFLIRLRAARLAAATGALVLVAATCGGDTDAVSEPSAQSDGAGDTSASAETPTTGTVPASTEPSCEDGTLEERSYIFCTAGDVPDQGLVVALHGRSSSADEMRAVTELDRHAAPQGMAVVYPDATDVGWGDDSFTSPDRPAGDEDLVFLDDLVEELRGDPRIDDGTMGVVGFSNGASMALRYAAERPDEVHAVVSVAGQLPRDPTIRPTGRVPLLAVYGTADPIRRYDTGIPEAPDRQPGDSTPTLSTPETVAAFVTAAGGSPSQEGAQQTDPDPGDGTRLRTERWTDGDGTLAVLHTVVDGGHTWPSSQGQFTGGEAFGPTSRDLDTSAEAVTFLVDPDGP